MNNRRTAASIRRSYTGARSRAEGAGFEAIISSACDYYRAIGRADIENTPEPMKPLGGADRSGRFLACYTKQAQPDYKGTLKGGKAIVFEAKHTDSDRMQRSVISEEQEKQLNRHEKLGAECFVMVSFGFEQYFKIPWAVFRDMKDNYGRKYITPEDVQEYKIRYVGGVLQFL